MSKKRSGGKNTSKQDVPPSFIVETPYDQKKLILAVLQKVNFKGYNGAQLMQAQEAIRQYNEQQELLLLQNKEQHVQFKRLKIPFNDQDLYQLIQEAKVLQANGQQSTSAAVNHNELTIKHKAFLINSAAKNYNLNLKLQTDLTKKIMDLNEKKQATNNPYNLKKIEEQLENQHRHLRMVEAEIRAYKRKYGLSHPLAGQSITEQDKKPPRPK